MVSIVDRRLNPGSKSLENRQRFLRRAKALVQDAVKKDAHDRDVKGVAKGGTVTIPTDGIAEPRFHTDGGVDDFVVTGNKEHMPGDRIPRQSGGMRSGAADGHSEGEMGVTLTKEEFIDLFLGDLTLPDMVKRAPASDQSQAPHRAGYARTGSPTNLSVARTVRLAMARRVALGRPRPQTIEELEDELAQCSDECRREELRAEIDALKAKMRRIPFIDPVDMRFRRFERTPQPIIQAVMFCLMDVSASMSDHMRELAKRFYMLLYVFLTRKYPHVEVVFIRHTSIAQEVDERTFFSGGASGGTVVSGAFHLMVEIIKSRFPPWLWNIYVAQASDGDNAFTDMGEMMRVLDEEVMQLIQYLYYLEVAGDDPDMHAFYHLATRGESPLWELYQRMADGGGRVAIRKVQKVGEILPIFRDLFKSRGDRHV